jgi:hypothetical protein
MSLQLPNSLQLLGRTNSQLNIKEFSSSQQNKFSQNLPPAEKRKMGEVTDLSRKRSISSLRPSLLSSLEP